MISTVYRNFVPLHIQTLLLQIISEYFYIENRLKTLCWKKWVKKITNLIYKYMINLRRQTIITEMLRSLYNQTTKAKYPNSNNNMNFSMTIFRMIDIMVIMFVRINWVRMLICANGGRYESSRKFSVCTLQTELAMTELTFGTVSVFCLIDTESTTSLGYFRVFNQFKTAQALITPTLSRTLSVVTQIYNKSIVDVPKEFNIENKTISIKLVDLRNKCFDFIIESNILKSIREVIDLLNNKILVNKLRRESWTWNAS